MKRVRIWWIAGAAALAVASFAGVAATFAQQTPGAGVTPTFIDRVAQKLGLSSSAVSDAVVASANDQIDQRVADGQITQAEADQLKARIAASPDKVFSGAGRGGREHGGRGVFGGDQLATFLGATPAQLRTELQANGATLATVAQAHGKSRDELKTFLTQQMQTRLDKEVAAGEMTQDQANTKAAGFTANLDTMIDRSGPPAGGMGGGRGHMDGDPADGPNDGSATPGTSTTPTATN